MTSIVINGNAYSDDGSTPQDMQHYGYLTHLLPMIGDTATVAGQVAIDAAQAAIDAGTASNGALALRGTSTTSLAVSAGTKTLTTQTGKQFTAGNYVTISRTSAPTTLMHGVVTSYSGATLIVEVATIAGSGTFTDWTIALSGASGEQGPSGNGVMPYVAKTGAYTVVTTDRGSLIDCTSGTFTLSFQACATLGADWSVYIRNSGTGVITLDPNGSETIDGASSYAMPSGIVVMLQCDGSVLRVGFCTITQLTKLPIFSSGSQNLSAASAMETLENSAHLTGLPTYSGQVVYASTPDLFIAGTAGNVSTANVASSPDGITWTLRAMPSSAYWMLGSNGVDKFMATLSASTTVATSTNGTTWAAATALPGASLTGLSSPTYNGNTVMVLSNTASTSYTSSNNGSSWATQTLPAAAGSISPFCVGGLFWYHASGTTAYTSSTGATGSWTARTMPFTPGNMLQDFDGSLFCNTATSKWRSTDGVNWTDLGFVLTTCYSINGVWAAFNTTFGEAKSRHNGVFTSRVSEIDCTQTVYTRCAKNAAGTVFIVPSWNTKIGRIAPAESTASTALFTR